MKIIEVNNISFGYSNMPIFSEVDFTINKGDFVAIIGANGSGKSTLLKLVLGELVSSTGQIRLFNEDVQHFKEWSKIGYVPQKGLSSHSNFPATAEEIVMANLFSQIGLLRFPKKEHREKAHTALKQVGMQEYAKELIGNLSGGQLQRVMLARVMVNEPDIMILDEPTTGLDAETIKGLYQWLNKINKEAGLTILMVTHDIANVHQHVSRILCLEEGSLIELNKEQIHHELSHKHKHPKNNKAERIDKNGDI